MQNLFFFVLETFKTHLLLTLEIEFDTIRNTLEHYKANRLHYAKMRQKIKKTRLIPVCNTLLL
jgi:hypothetical protein